MKEEERMGRERGKESVIAWTKTGDKRESLNTRTVTQLLSNSLVIPLISVTSGTAGKESDQWEGRT